MFNATPTPARPHRTQDAGYSQGWLRLCGPWDARRATDAGPGTGTEEQDAAAGPAAGEKSCPRARHTGGSVRIRLHCRLIGYFHLNVQSIFPLSKPAGIFHSCPGGGSLSTLSCLEQKSHQGSPGGNSKAEGLPTGAGQPCFRSDRCPPPESPARTPRVRHRRRGSPTPAPLPQAHPLTWVSGSGKSPRP